MNIKALLFEDNQFHADRVKRSLSSWANEHGHTMEISEYKSPVYFDVNEIGKFDFVISDVKMPELDGMEFAHEIRSINKTIPIVFISDYVEYSLNGYEVGAVRFLNKNDMHFDTKFCDCMDCLYEIICSFSDKCYKFKYNGMLCSVLFRDMLYIEVKDHELKLRTINGDFSERRTIGAIKEDLPPQFIQCSRSVIVNITHVMSISTQTAVLSTGVKIAISRSFVDSVIKAFLLYH